MTLPAVAARVRGLSHHYGKTRALDRIDLEIPAGRMVGLIGPDGVGKSTLLSILAGARVIQEGRVEVLDGDMAQRAHRDRACPRIAYMPQGLGKNLYPTLSVEENLQFFARLFGHGAAERRRRIDDLTRSTGLHPFLSRPAGKLSGGMKQKLSLCCALIHDPDFLILDEPTTGVDPLARAQFWDLIARIRAGQPGGHAGPPQGPTPPRGDGAQRQGGGITVIVATAYMDEAQRFDWLVAMDQGQVLATGAPAELLASTGQKTLESAFIHLLPPSRREGYAPVEIPPLPEGSDDDIAIEAEGLTMRFGDFVAVDHVSFRIRRGEIFGFLGSNGCGKSTTMRAAPGCSATRSTPTTWTCAAGSATCPSRSRCTASSRSARTWSCTPACSTSRPTASRTGSRPWWNASAWARRWTRCPTACRWASASGCRWPWRWCTSRNC